MGILNFLFRSVPFAWILLNLYILIKSFILNGYRLLGGNEWKLLEHAKIVYPFHSSSILYYDFSEFLFYCIVPIYLYMIGKRIFTSLFNSDR